MGMAEDEEKKEGYSWEGSLERSWDAIQEDEHGNLQINATSNDDQKRHRRLEIARSVRKGLIRYLYIIIDLSKGMSLKDWKPNRCTVVNNIVQQFIKDFMDQSPISQLGIIGIQGSTAKKLSELSGNSKMHIDKLQKLVTVSHEPSLQNALEMAKSSLKLVPSYGSREILVLYGSLTTADPGDIFATSTSLKRENIRCSFVGIGAEMYLLKRIAEETNGTYFVASNETQMKNLLVQFTIPSLTLAQNAAKFSTLVEMGFPERKRGVLSLCVCHQAFTTIGYFCPRCRSKSCDLPITCQVCNLPLISSPHLARSFHHLFPVEVFVSKPLSEDNTTPVYCQGCHQRIAKFQYQCPGCNYIYCEDCDIYIHDSLHNCIGCQLNCIR